MTYGYMAVPVLFISIGWIPFPAPILDNAHPLFALLITISFYLHRHLVEMTVQDAASGSLVYKPTN